MTSYTAYVIIVISISLTSAAMETWIAASLYRAGDTEPDPIDDLSAKLTGWWWLWRPAFIGLFVAAAFYFDEPGLLAAPLSMFVGGAIRRLLQLRKAMRSKLSGRR